MCVSTFQSVCLLTYLSTYSSVNLYNTFLLISYSHQNLKSEEASKTLFVPLQDSQVENSVIGSTMVNLRNILLDIPVDTDLRFFLATNTPPLLASTAYRNAKSLCDDKVDTYMRNIKVAYYFNDDDDAMEGGEDTGLPAQGSLQRADSVASVSRVGEIEDPELFCPPETAKTGSGQLSHTPDRKRSIQSPSIPGSTCNLRQDLTYELMESPKRAPPQSSRALPHPRRENLPPPPSAPGKKSPPQATPDGESPDHYMTMSSVAKLPSALPASPSGLNKESSSQSAADTEPADHYMTMSNVAKLPSVLSTPPSATGKASTPQSAANREPADQYMTMSSVIKQPSVLSTSPSGLSRDSAEDKGSAGPYMTMIGAVQRPAASRLASFPLANPLGPPPPPFKPARLKSAQDTDIYSPVWNGDTGQCPPEEHEEESTTEKPEPQKSGSTLRNPFPQLAAPFSLQKDRAQVTAHRRSRLAFGDSFLTLPLNTDTGSTGTDTSPSVPAAARPLIVTTKPKSKSGSSQSAAQEQPYEVMRRADPRQPSLPQKASPLQSGSQLSGTRCLPLPALPSQEANNCSTTADYETMDNQAPSTESSLGGRGRHDSYTYYEGYDPAAAKNISRNKQEGAVHPGSGLTGDCEGGSDTDKTAEGPGNIYENDVINLRLCDDSLSMSGSVSSSTSGSERGPSLDKTDGPTKASDRGAASKKPLLPPRKPLSRMDAVNKTSFESDSSGTDMVFPPLPLPRPPDKHGSPPPGRTCLSKKGGNRARPASPPRSAAGVTAHPRDKFRDSGITAISAHLRDRFRNSGVSSNLSSEDDLPLGATFANFRSACSDSGCVVESVESRSVASALAARSDVSSLSVGSLCQTLQEVRRCWWLVGCLTSCNMLVYLGHGSAQARVSQYHCCWLVTSSPSSMLVYFKDGSIQKSVGQCYCCWSVAERPSNVLVYLRDGSTQTSVHAATLR